MRTWTRRSCACTLRPFAAAPALWLLRLHQLDPDQRTVWLEKVPTTAGSRLPTLMRHLLPDAADGNAPPSSAAAARRTPSPRGNTTASVDGQRGDWMDGRF